MEHLAFYSHEDGKKPNVLDYMEELEIFVKEPMKLVHEILMVMWERGEMGDSPLLNSAKTTLWSCMLKWDQMDSFFKKEYRGDHPADDYRTETKNAFESRICSDIGFKISELSDELKESLRTKFFGREEFQWLKRVIDAYIKKEEREKREIETSEEIQEYGESLMAA